MAKLSKHSVAVKDAEFENFEACRLRDNETFMENYDASTKAAMRQARDAAHRKRFHFMRQFGVFNPPKSYRESYILKRRDKRNPILKHDECIEFQSFGDGIGKVATGALATVAAIFVRRLTGLVKKSDDLVGSITDYVSIIRDYATELKRKIGNTLWLIPLLIVIYFLRKSIPRQVYAILATALAVVLGGKVWKYFQEYFDVGGEKKKHATVGTAMQAGVEIPHMGKLLAAAFAFSVFKGRNQERNVTEFQKRVTLFERFGESWDGLSDWIVSSIDSIVQFCSDHFGTPRVDWFKKERTPLMLWADKVDRLCCKSVETARVSPSDLKEMIDCLREGHLYLEKFRNTKSHKVISEYVVKITNYMIPFQGAINARNNFRFEPLAMVLYGLPGVGKTLMIIYLSMTILIEAGILPKDVKKEEILAEIWQKGSSEFWNGYAEQKVLAIDDMFQKRADLGDPESDYLNFIKLVSSFSCPLNFADLNSKGKIYFLSYLIIATTNLSHITDQANVVIIDPGAVVRRIAFPLTLTVDPAFAQVNGQLDYKKFRQELIKVKREEEFIDRFPWHIWRVAKHDFFGNEPDEPSVSMKLKIREIVNVFKERLEQHSTVEQDIDDFLHGVTDEFVDAEDNIGLQAGANASEILDAAEGNVKLTNVSDVVQAETASPGCTPKACVKALIRAYNSDVEDVLAHWSFWRLWLHNVKWLAIGAGIILLFKAATCALIAAVQCLFNLATGRRNYSRKNKDDSVQKQSNRYEGPVRNAKLQAYTDVIPTKVRNNTYTLSVTTPAGFIPYGSVTFLVDNMAVQPHHFTTDVLQHVAEGKLTRESQMTLAHNEAGSCPIEGSAKKISDYRVSFTVGYYLDLMRHSVPDRELEFLSFPCMRSHANIVSFYINEVDVRSLGGNEGVLCLYRAESPTTFIRYAESLPSLRKWDEICTVTKPVKNVVGYRASTQQGDCGAAVVFKNATHFGCRQAIGLHIAGDVKAGTGYCAILTQKDIAEASAALKPIKDSFEGDLAAQGIKLNCGFELPYFGGSMLPIGVVENKANLTSKSKYYKTKLYGKWGEYAYSPAHMKPVLIGEEKVYPMVKAVEPYTTPVYIYEHNFLQQAMHLAVAPFNALTKDYSKRIYTFEEAVLGVPQEKFRAIPRATSAGYPMCLYTAKGKKDFFGEGEEYDLNTPQCAELRARVRHVLDCAANGERLAHIYMDFLKDELRSEAKNSVVATRLISCAPLDYTIAWRQMFGAYSAAMFRVNTESGMAPGICTFSDWNKLAQLLKSKGSDCFDGDFKGFDSSEQPVVHMLMLHVINDWYDDGPVNARIREVLWLDLVHSRHITGLGNNQCYLVQWNKSLPSGHPFTTIVNSIYSLFLLIASYIYLTGDFVHFWRSVFTVTYGDDNVSNVADTVKDVFNQRDRKSVV